MESAVKNNRYVAFFRGINVGGNKIVPMADLQHLFGTLGCENVKTLLNSGNVVFESAKARESDLTARIERAFQKKFGFESTIMVMDLLELRAMVAKDPFRGITSGPSTRFFVTFLRDTITSSLKLPYRSPKGDFRILKGSGRALFSVTLETYHTLDAMAFLEEHFGAGITTRNWNTIKKIAGL